MKIYKYLNIPPYWASIKLENVDVSELKFSKITKGIENLPEYPTQIIVLGTVAPIVNFIVGKFGVANIRGIDFSEYFADTFNKDVTKSYSFAKYTVVYNVGMEKALNKTFSKQLLQGLLQKIKDFGGHTFIQSKEDLTSLRRDYDLQTTNVVKLEEIEQGKKI